MTVFFQYKGVIGACHKQDLVDPVRHQVLEIDLRVITNEKISHG